MLYSKQQRDKQAASSSAQTSLPPPKPVKWSVRNPVTGAEQDYDSPEAAQKEARRLARLYANKGVSPSLAPRYTELEPYRKSDGSYDVVKYLQDNPGSESKLAAIGFDSGVVAKAVLSGTAYTTLAPFKKDDGYDLADFLQANPDGKQVLVDAGFDTASIDRAVKVVAARAKLTDYRKSDNTYDVSRYLQDYAKNPSPAKLQVLVEAGYDAADIQRLGAAYIALKGYLKDDGSYDLDKYLGEYAKSPSTAKLQVLKDAGYDADKIGVIAAAFVKLAAYQKGSGSLDIPKYLSEYARNPSQDKLQILLDAGYDADTVTKMSNAYVALKGYTRADGSIDVNRYIRDFAYRNRPSQTDQSASGFAKRAIYRKQFTEADVKAIPELAFLVDAGYDALSIGKTLFSIYRPDVGQQGPPPTYLLIGPEGDIVFVDADQVADYTGRGYTSDVPDDVRAQYQNQLSGQAGGVLFVVPGSNHLFRDLDGVYQQLTPSGWKDATPPTQYLVNPANNQITAFISGTPDVAQRIEAGWRSATQAEVTEATGIGLAQANLQYLVNPATGQIQSFVSGGQISKDAIAAGWKAPVDQTRLPDGSWVSNANLEAVRGQSAELYEVLTTKGYDEYQQRAQELDQEAAGTISTKEPAFQFGVPVEDEELFRQTMAPYEAEGDYDLVAALDGGVDAGLLGKWFGSAAYDAVMWRQDRDAEGVRLLREGKEQQEAAIQAVQAQAQLERDNVQLATGEWVPRASEKDAEGNIVRVGYEDMTEGDRNLLNELGVAEFNRVAGESVVVLAADQARGTVKLATGERIPKTDYQNMTPEDKVLINEIGVAAFNKDVERRNDIALSQKATAKEQASVLDDLESQGFVSGSEYDLVGAIDAGVSESRLASVFGQKAVTTAKDFLANNVKLGDGQYIPKQSKRGAGGEVIEPGLAEIEQQSPKLAADLKALGYTPTLGEMDKLKQSDPKAYFGMLQKYDMVPADAVFVAASPDGEIRYTVPDTSPSVTEKRWENVRTGKTITEAEYAALGYSAKRDDYRLTNEAAAERLVEVGKSSGEFALSLAPGVWVKDLNLGKPNQMAAWQIGVNTGLDLLTLIPLAGWAARSAGKAILKAGTSSISKALSKELPKALTKAGERGLAAESRAIGKAIPEIDRLTDVLKNAATATARAEKSANLDRFVAAIKVESEARSALSQALRKFGTDIAVLNSKLADTGIKPLSKDGLDRAVGLGKSADDFSKYIVETQKEIVRKGLDKTLLSPAEAIQAAKELGAAGIKGSKAGAESLSTTATRFATGAEKTGIRTGAGRAAEVTQQELAALAREGTVTSTLPSRLKRMVDAYASIPGTISDVSKASFRGAAAWVEAINKEINRAVVSGQSVGLREALGNSRNEAVRAAADYLRKGSKVANSAIRTPTDIYTESYLREFQKLLGKRTLDDLDVVAAREIESRAADAADKAAQSHIQNSLSQLNKESRAAHDNLARFRDTKVLDKWDEYIRETWSPGGRPGRVIPSPSGPGRFIPGQERTSPRVGGGGRGGGTATAELSTRTMTPEQLTRLGGGAARTYQFSLRTLSGTRIFTVVVNQDTGQVEVFQTPETAVLPQIIMVEDGEWPLIGPSYTPTVRPALSVTTIPRPATEPSVEPIVPGRRKSSEIYFLNQPRASRLAEAIPLLGVVQTVAGKGSTASVGQQTIGVGRSSRSSTRADAAAVPSQDASTATRTTTSAAIKSSTGTAVKPSTAAVTKTASSAATATSAATQTKAATQTQSATSPATGTQTKAATSTSTKTPTKPITRTPVAPVTAPATATVPATNTVPATAPATKTSPALKAALGIPVRTPVRPPTRPPVMLPPELEGGEGEGAVSVPLGSLAWKQGYTWKYIPAPWDGLKPVSLRRGETPVGAIPRGRTPAETIQVIGKPKSKVPRTASIDLGIADVFISDYGRHIEFAGKGEDTDVGLSLDDNTIGMSVPAVGRVRQGRRAKPKSKRRQSARRYTQNPDMQFGVASVRTPTAKAI